MKTALGTHHSPKPPPSARDEERLSLLPAAAEAKLEGSVAGMPALSGSNTSCPDLKGDVLPRNGCRASQQRYANGQRIS